MRKLKAAKVEPEKPKPQNKSKSCYGKYKCQYKQKSILTKLNNDSGYPQQLLHTRGHSMPQNSNYVEQNKQNLKNFFKDRIPPENNAVTLLMKKQTQLIHPKRIFEIKQQQFQLKNKTKISLKNSFDVNFDSNLSGTFEKFDANFHINDKNRELKEKYGGGGRESFVHYEPQNFRRGTQSHIEKRSKVLKKQAYDKVFGPDISSMSRTNGFQKRQIYMQSPPRAKSISLNSTYHQTKTHKQLKNLIQKMHDYKNKLEQTDQVLKLGGEVANNAENEETMVTLIKNMTKLYQQRSINQGAIKIESLEDIAKLSKNFYQEMQSHKVHRLAKRKQMAFQTLPVVQNPSYSIPEDGSPFRSFNTQRLQPDAHSQLSGNDENESYGEQESVKNSTELIRADFTSPVRYRFTLLRKTLVKWAALFYIYNIRKENIFLAFKANKDPYAMEGSYAFFKFIKSGDLAPVKTFLQNQTQFAFEVDISGRTPICSAAYYNQTQIAEVILKVGVNSDMRCFKGHTALYYAVSRGNVALVKALLQQGACPWSTPRNPYREMIITGDNSEQLQILFNNARKVYIGMQLQPTIQKRKAFWARTHMKIQQNDLRTYETPL